MLSHGTIHGPDAGSGAGRLRRRRAPGQPSRDEGPAEGHCDERGSDVYNLRLGESRADKIRNALIQQGVSADRIKVISYGKELSFCAEDTESCYQQNRRAQFVVEKDSN